MDIAAKEKKNVLVTTMSVFNKNGMRVNYYYCLQKGENKLFCEGISSLEAGSKYFLSKYPIDEILVIGTKETVREEDVLEVADITEEEELAKSEEKWSNCFYQGDDISAYEFYKYRIAFFLSQRQSDRKYNAADEVAGEDITDVRKMDLERILDNIMEGTLGEENEAENKADIPKLLINEKDEFWRKLKEAIQKSIRDDFENGDAYLKYVTEKEDLKNYQFSYSINEDVAERYKEERKKISEDRKLTIFEKEFLYVALSNKVIESIYRNELLNRETEIMELRVENARLSYEIESLRTRRQIKEYDYVKYVVYKRLEKKYRIVPLKENRENIRILFVPEQLKNLNNGSKGDKSVDNLSGIVKALQENGENEINLYIDMQGGNRTSSYVRNAALSILSNQNPDKIHIKEIVATNYNSLKPGASKIVNETERYRVLDLASGMNAFIQYGKADMIQNYCNDMLISSESSVGRLVQHMVKIDEAISLCDINGLIETIQKLRNFFDTEDVKEDSFAGNIFHILQEGIRNDYGKLLEKPNDNEDIDYLKLISWCTRKGFIQQALTLIEDKMPTVYYERGIITWQFDESVSEIVKQKLEEVLHVPKHEKRKENIYFYNLKNIKGQTKELRETLKEIDIDLWNKINIMIQEQENSSISEKKLCPGRIDEKELCEIITKMHIDDEVNFIEQYCKFRRWEDSFEKDKILHLVNEENLYEYVGKEIWGNKDIYFSIVKCCEKEDYSYKGINFRIMVRIHSNLESEKKKLDRLFLLHEALKKERNCSNHASAKGMRLPIATVKRAIEIYIKWTEDMFDKIKRADDHE